MSGVRTIFNMYVCMLTLVFDNAYVFRCVLCIIHLILGRSDCGC